jgi:hypothetical protein
MSAKVAYLFFLTGSIVAIVFVLLLQPITLSADAKAILEMLLGALTTILMAVVHFVFPGINPTLPVTPATGAPK